MARPNPPVVLQPDLLLLQAFQRFGELIHTGGAVLALIALEVPDSIFNRHTFDQFADSPGVSRADISQKLQISDFPVHNFKSYFSGASSLGRIGNHFISLLTLLSNPYGGKIYFQYISRLQPSQLDTVPLQPPIADRPQNKKARIAAKPCNQCE
jgi:hypothetical protein